MPVRRGHGRDPHPRCHRRTDGPARRGSRSRHWVSPGCVSSRTPARPTTGRAPPSRTAGPPPPTRERRPGRPRRCRQLPGHRAPVVVDGAVQVPALRPGRRPDRRRHRPPPAGLRGRGTRRTSFRSERSLREQSAAVPGRPGQTPTRAMITISTCATFEDHAAGNYWSDEFHNPEHRIEKIGVLRSVDASERSPADTNSTDVEDASELVARLLRRGAHLVGATTYVNGARRRRRRRRRDRREGRCRCW